MSRSRSDASVIESDASDPLRPADHADGDGDRGITQPQLGLVGWMRWGWRQLTSMRTALVLLLLLAIAAIPGSIVPQRSADPNGVIDFESKNPGLYPVYNALQLFDVYSSVWFSAIYILLFISLIGCVIPRTKHHFKAMRAVPPRTPMRLSRLDDYATAERIVPDGQDAEAEASRVIDLAQAQLRKAGYRVERYDTPATGARSATASVSAERGYARETGNLVFHAALVGVLISVGVGGGLTYTGQTVIAEGDSFVNSLGLGYTSFNPGRFVDTEHLPPYSLSLDSFEVSYVPVGQAGQGMAGDFAANLTTREPGHDPEQNTVRVNHPLDMAGDRVYLMGNGYAPTITVRNPAGDVVFREDVEFLPQDANMTSQGVIKIADGLSENGAPTQLGMVGFFYPTAATLHTGALTSAYPALANPVLTLWVYAGDLGINDGTARNVYALDPSEMTQLAGGTSGTDALQLEPGKTVDLPDGMGTISFDAAPRYASFDVMRNPAQQWVLISALAAVLGLLSSLFVPRRRMWVKAMQTDDGVLLQYAALARGDDPTLERAVEKLRKQHRERL